MVAESFSCGASQIWMVSTKLADGSTMLGNGLATLKDGTTHLATVYEMVQKRFNAYWNPTDETLVCSSKSNRINHRRIQFISN